MLLLSQLKVKLTSSVLILISMNSFSFKVTNGIDGSILVLKSFLTLVTKTSGSPENPFLVEVKIILAFSDRTSLAVKTPLTLSNVTISGFTSTKV